MLTDVPREGESMYSDSRAKPDYKIDPATGCWVWQKATFNGYPQSGALKPWHVYYELAYGPIPEGFHVHHRCENRACINPEHLEALPAKEHIALHMAKRWGIPLETVKEIRRLGELPGARAVDVAARFGLDRRAVGRYWSGETWPELGGRVEPALKICPNCGDEFNHGYRHKVYCSPGCQKQAKGHRQTQRRREAA